MDDFVGLTVAQVLAICGASYGDLRMVDEPPGKLRAVKLTCHKGGQPKNAVLELQYNSGLFSPDRSWDPAVVLEQKVVKVHDSTSHLY